MGGLKLYEFTENYENLLTLLEENPEMDNEDLKAALNGIKESAEDKIFNTAEFIKKLEDDVENIKKRKNELDTLSSQKKKQVTKLKEYLLEHMTRMEIPKADNGVRVISYQNNPPSLYVKDISKVPDQFKSYKTVLEVNGEDLPKKWQNKMVKSEVSPNKKELLNYLKQQDEKEYSSYAEITQKKRLNIK